MSFGIRTSEVSPDGFTRRRATTKRPQKAHVDPGVMGMCAKRRSCWTCNGPPRCGPGHPVTSMSGAPKNNTKKRTLAPVHIVVLQARRSLCFGGRLPGTRRTVKKKANRRARRSPGSLLPDRSIPFIAPVRVLWFFNANLVEPHYAGVNC